MKPVCLDMSPVPDASVRPTCHRARIGIIGGLGSAATVDFLAKIVAATATHVEQDHVEIVVDFATLTPDRSLSVLGAGPSAAPALIAAALRLRKAEVNVIAMPCNTAHAYRAEIQAEVDLPFISIIETAVCAALCRAPKARRIGLIATRACIAAGLYQAEFARHRCDIVIAPDALLDVLMTDIYAIKLNTADDATYLSLRRHAEWLADAGAEVIIAGCTEVPIMLRGDELPVPLIDSTLALAHACVTAGGGILKDNIYV